MQGLSLWGHKVIEAHGHKVRDWIRHPTRYAGREMPEYTQRVVINTYLATRPGMCLVSLSSRNVKYQRSSILSPYSN